MTSLRGLLTFSTPTDDNRIDVDLTLIPETGTAADLYGTVLADRNSTSHSYLDAFTLIVNDKVDAAEFHKIVSLHLSQDVTVYHFDLLAGLELDDDEPIVDKTAGAFISRFAYMAKIFALFDGDPDAPEDSDDAKKLQVAISELDAARDMAAMMTSEQCESRLLACFG